MSEFPISISILKTEDAIEKVGSAGKATLMTELRVVDEQGNDRAPGEEGEILLHSPATMEGYWQRPEETAEALVDGWLHTGDLGYLDEDGFLYIVGRKKDMIITGGLNVYPAEIEKVIGVFEGVAECAIIGTADDQFGEVGVAHVVVRPGAEIDLVELRAHVSEQLSTYKVPKHWILRDEPLPRNPSGKVQKNLLEKVAPGA
jgi:acyl-CoA synthetase (AMP-forming)/AMP-acid ligase II